MHPFADLCLRVEHHIKLAYGIPIVIRDIPDPLTGDLNGAEIHIDYAVTPEQRLFLLAHLFGHTVQWNTDPAAYDLGRPQQPPVSADQLPALMDYERQAASYALGLLHELGITETDQWFADYAACDAAYLRHFYITGEKREFLSFWQNGAALIKETPVPAFTPVMRSFRSDGVVI
ncbi:MAG TPA: hypothetical protein VK752_03110 [Bryobacteraceae bacterium]|jgi:hypothetical protein|nr:hypothetical protein [Bryobacteraceae bacterium]